MIVCVLVQSPDGRFRVEEMRRDIADDALVVGGRLSLRDGEGTIVAIAPATEAQRRQGIDCLVAVAPAAE